MSKKRRTFSPEWPVSFHSVQRPGGHGDIEETGTDQRHRQPSWCAAWATTPAPGIRRGPQKRAGTSPFEVPLGGGNHG